MSSEKTTEAYCGVRSEEANIDRLQAAEVAVVETKVGLLRRAASLILNRSSATLDGLELGQVVDDDEAFVRDAILLGFEPADISELGFSPFNANPGPLSLAVHIPERYKANS